VEPYHCTTCGWRGDYSGMVQLTKDNPRKVCPECGDYPFCIALIPKGLYCYHNLSHYKDGTTYVNMCPYWKRNTSKDEQESGYCEYLKRGDWEVNEVSLLWDCCKECDVKTEIGGEELC
jgi:hypothetical protein